MKVYSCPAQVPAPTPNFKNYDHKIEQKREEQHQTALADWLRKNGYTGPHTGKIYSTPIADGAAIYMFGDNGAKSVLIHLPYGDGYNSPDVKHLSKTVILQRISQGEKTAKLFGTGDESDHGKWWSARKVGEIVHYSNGFGEYVRGEIVLDDGQKKMRPTALVGNWKAYDLPRIGADGSIQEGSHVRWIREGKIMQPNVSNMVEAVGVKAGGKDPRGEPALDITPPTPSAEQIELKRLNDIRNQVYAALNNEGLFKGVDVKDTLIAVRKMLNDATI